MANRVQILRSATALNRPAVNSRQPGELYVNWPDKQLGVIDSTQTPEDLIAVRFFSATTSYVAGDYVKQGTQLYQATAAVPAGAFNASQWTKVTLATDTAPYLPLTGGTLTGPGNLTVNGTATFGSTVTVAGLTTVNNSINSKGPSASLWAFDRGNSGGDTTKVVGLYRDGNVGHLYMDTAGDVMTMAAAGTATFGHLLTCSAGLTVNGAVATCNAGVTAYNAAGYSLTVSSGAGSHAIGVYSVAGQRSWLCGEFSDGTFHIYDNNSGDRFSIDNSGNTILGAAGGTVTSNGPLIANWQSHYPLQVTAGASLNAAIQFNVSGQYQWLMGPVATVGTNTCYVYGTSSGGARMMWANTYTNQWGNATMAIGAGSQINIGATGAYEINGAILVSPQSSGNGAGGAISCYGATQWSTNLRSRVDSTAAYPAYFLYGTTGVGWITTDGGNVYYSTACDARRKTGIRPLASELDVGALIDALTPCAFDWQEVRFKTPGTVEPTEDPDIVNRTEGVEVVTQAPRSHGFLAQDLQAVVPGIVTRGNLSDDEEELLGADYSKMVPYLVAELQALRKRVHELEAKA